MSYTFSKDDCPEHNFSTNGGVHCKFGTYDGQSRCENCGILDDKILIPVNVKETPKDDVFDKDEKLVVQYVSCGMRYGNGKKGTKFKRLSRHKELDAYFNCNSHKTNCPLGMLCEFKFEPDNLNSAWINPLNKFYEHEEEIGVWKVEERVSMQQVKVDQVKNKAIRKNKDISSMTLKEIKDAITYRDYSQSHMIAFIAEYLVK